MRRSLRDILGGHVSSSHFPTLRPSEALYHHQAGVIKLRLLPLGFITMKKPTICYRNMSSCHFFQAPNLRKSKIHYPFFGGIKQLQCPDAQCMVMYGIFTYMA